MKVKIVRKKGETEKIFLQGDHKKQANWLCFLRFNTAKLTEIGITYFGKASPNLKSAFWYS